MSFQYNNKQMNVIFELFKDVTVGKEVKIYLLLECVHNGNIGITKAKELCTELGIFHKHWTEIDAKATTEFEKKYKTLEPSVIQRMRDNDNAELPITKKTVYNGNLLLHNIPHVQRETAGPNSETEYITSDVMYKMAHIFEYMIENQILEFDYDNYGDIHNQTRGDENVD